MEKIALDLSCGQYTDEGAFLLMLFDNNFFKALTRLDYTGYPYHGARHSLRLYLTLSDIHAFGDLLFTQYGEQSKPFLDLMEQRLKA